MSEHREFTTTGPVIPQARFHLVAFTDGDRVKNCWLHSSVTKDKLLTQFKDIDYISVILVIDYADADSDHNLMIARTPSGWEDHQ